jgi:hypothetical protein
MNSFSSLFPSDVDCKSHYTGGSLVMEKFQQENVYSECKVETHPYVRQSIKTFAMMFEKWFQISDKIRFIPSSESQFAFNRNKSLKNKDISDVTV